MTTKYTGNYKGVGQMLTAPWMVAEMKRRAEKVLAEAEATAPDAPPLGEGYKYEFETESGVKNIGDGDRAYARVRNSSPHAVHVEYGDGRTPKHRTLGKALKAAR